MSPSQWRILRALRIVLACLVLWLPARGASASLAPADTVVMIAGATGAAGAALGGEVVARTKTEGDARSAISASPYATVAPRLVRLPPRYPSRTTNRAVAPRYLLHCALLR